MKNLENLIAELCPKGVKFVTIAEIANVSIGEFIRRDRQVANGQYPVYNGGTFNTGYYNKYNMTANKIIISARGANAGFVNKILTNYWAGNSCYSIETTDKNVDWNYLYYTIKNEENNLIFNQQRRGCIPSISKKQIKNFKVAIPPLEVQKEIVKILDKFTDLISLLKREFAARQKQYECCREKLLNC